MSYKRLYDDYQGREIILKSLNNSVKDNKSITKTFSKNINGIYQYFEVRETTISGPGGIRKMEVTFEKMPDGTRRMTTVIFKGGY